MSEKGSDWTTLKFKKCPSGEVLPDVLTKLKFTGISWDHGNQGVFYSMYPDSNNIVGSATEQLERHSFYYHKLGEEQSEDMLCFDFPDNPEYMIHGDVTEDGRFLVCQVDRGCDPYNLIYYFPMADFKYQRGRHKGHRLDMKPIVAEFEARTRVVHNTGDSLFLLTNWDAPMFRLVTVDVNNPAKENWKTLVAEREDGKLDHVLAVNGNQLLINYMEDVKNKLYVHDMESGEKFFGISIDIGAVSGIFGEQKLSEFFFCFDSFLEPGSVYRVDLAQNDPKPQVLKRSTLKGFDPDEFQTIQVFYPSKDGTKIPMYIVHKKGLVLDGSFHTMLYGYGGFNIPMLPSFSVSRLMYMANMGGVFAAVNLRGGSEYGEKWHEAGMLAKKQNVFDDFIAAAEYLVNKKYATKEKLISHGGSNGGLLVAVCAQQRPDLFGAVINRVGVLDMLRYHRFTIGKAWVPEFGDPDRKEDFSYLINYSPLHNLCTPNGNKQYPAMLLMTADHDDRVVPLHSLKYMAELYHKVHKCESQTEPLLIRIEVKAGHGHGKPTTKVIEEMTDLYSFVARVMDVQWKD